MAPYIPATATLQAKCLRSVFQAPCSYVFNIVTIFYQLNTIIIATCRVPRENNQNIMYVK